MSSDPKQIEKFLAANGFEGAELKPLAGDASFRRYARVRRGERKAMLMDAPPDKENVRSFVAIARHLHAVGYSAPEIFAEDVASGLLLIEDLGDDLFTAVLKDASASERMLYEAAIDLVAEWHAKKKTVADAQALPLPKYDHALLTQEASLFCDWYLPQVLGEKRARELRAEYLELWKEILARANLSTDQWVHRDYHADNLMWLPDRKGLARVGLLDFQDGVYGDAAYDLVSLLEDARRDVSPELADSMLARYLKAVGADKTRFMEAYGVLGAQRNSKIVGIFVRLAARDGKYAYLHHLPRVWRYLEHDLMHPILRPLREWLDRHVASQQRGAIDVKPATAQAAATA